jgi:uncharacterized membrane protein AbrB (regulator of aidB expression)
MVSLTTTFLLASLFLFLFGIAGGWFLSRKESENIKTKMQIVVGLLVTIVWVVSIAAEIIIPAYSVSVLIHGIMGAVVGYLFSEDGITINIGENK